MPAADARGAAPRARPAERARAAAQQVERQHGSERERRGLDADVDDPEPQDLEGQRHEAARRVEREPEAKGREPAASPPVGAGAGRGGASALPAGVLRASASAPPTARLVAAAAPDRASIPSNAHQHPGRRAARRRPRPARSRRRGSRPCARPWPRIANLARARNGSDMPISTVGGSSARKWASRGSPRRGVEPRGPDVEQVVVEQRRERAERSRSRPRRSRTAASRGAGVSRALQHAARVAADAQAGHERGHDHRDRVDRAPLPSARIRCQAVW